MEKIIEVRQSTASNGKVMLKARLESGQTINIFSGPGYGGKPDQFMMLADAGYTELIYLKEDEVSCWTQHPICIEVQANGKWLNLASVYNRKEGDVVDEDRIPDRDLLRKFAQRQCRHLIRAHSPVAWLDCETTGFGLDDELVSLAVIPGLSCRIRPQRPERLLIKGKNGQSASDINGITPESLEDAKPFVEYASEIATYLQGAIWVAYNSDFDSRMIVQNFLQVGRVPPSPLAVVDAMELFTNYHGEWSPTYKKFMPKKLAEACEIMGIELFDAHTAEADTRAMIMLVEEMSIER